MWVCVYMCVSVLCICVCAHVCVCVATRKAFLTENEGELIHACGGCRGLSCRVRQYTPWSIILETVTRGKTRWDLSCCYGRQGPLIQVQGHQSLVPRSVIGNCLIPGRPGPLRGTMMWSLETIKPFLPIQWQMYTEMQHILPLSSILKVNKKYGIEVYIPILNFHRVVVYKLNLPFSSDCIRSGLKVCLPWSHPCCNHDGHSCFGWLT